MTEQPRDRDPEGTSPPSIRTDRVRFFYHRLDRPPLLAVDHVSLSVEPGTHLAILGRNGSGKSTLARLFNALELPSEGEVSIEGLPTDRQDLVMEIRRRCGMVFQNPDNQIIGTTVEEEVAFGPENLGMPREAMREAVDQALSFVALSELRHRAPHTLSGGQKQKLALAGVLAMHTRILVLDEATSMLDPHSRQDLMALIGTLSREWGMTVVNITHHMDEAVQADRVVILSRGRVLSEGTPAEVFDQVGRIQQEGLDVPPHTEIAYRVARRLSCGLTPGSSVTQEGAADEVVRILRESTCPRLAPDGTSTPRKSYGFDRFARTVPLSPDAPTVIEVRDLSHTYLPGTPFETRALEQISFSVRKGELLGIIGHSGSGKSTLVQHLNGLIRPGAGAVRVLGMDASRGADLRRLRHKVGLLFQYPEHQLFEETVARDIAFGPGRMGLPEGEIRRRVADAAEVVGLSDDELAKSPFELSGGQRRRAAIAGVLAMEPEILILDEPAAGLDPAGRDEILGYAARLRDQGVTVILVSHSMEDIARLSDRILVMSDGRLIASGTPEQVYADAAPLESVGLAQPAATRFLVRLSRSLPGLRTDRHTPGGAVDAVLEWHRRQGLRPEVGP